MKFKTLTFRYFENSNNICVYKHSGRKLIGHILLHKKLNFKDFDYFMMDIETLTEILMAMKEIEIFGATTWISMYAKLAKW